MKTIVMTVCYIIDFENQKILLGLKKVRLGKGLYNGFGGHVEPDETIDQAAKREARAESGLHLGQLEKRAVVWTETSGQDEKIELHLYVCSDFSGQPRETEEMKPRWFHFSELKNWIDQIWPTDPYTLPWILAGYRFKANFYLSPDRQTVEKLQRVIVDKLPA
jgi:8-oxo-dGTP pyrophosphatase MutT (NUDIX family)